MPKASKETHRTAEELLRIEHELARGDGSTYERHLDEEAVMIVPGDRLDKQAAIEAMDSSRGWDEVSIANETVRELGADAALLTYLFRGRRGESRYAAVLSSAYVRDAEGGWKLAFHQQTPLRQTA